MNEIIFSVTSAPEGGFMAQALGHSIYTEADDWIGLRAAVRQAVWAAAGFKDILLSCQMKLEMGCGTEMEIKWEIQSRSASTFDDRHHPS